MVQANHNLDARPQRFVVWDHPLAEMVVLGIKLGLETRLVEVAVLPARDCMAALENGRADIAFLPALPVVVKHALFDVFPSFALSSWHYPYNKLVLKKGMSSKANTVAFDPRYSQAVFVAKAILKEHYGSFPEFVPFEGFQPGALLKTDTDAALIVGHEVPDMNGDGVWLDLGEEWFELTNYPLILGMMVTRKEEADLGMIQQMINISSALDQNKLVWEQTRNRTPEMQSFFSDDLRVRFDDLAMAGLTAFVEQLFYAQLIPELIDVPFVSVPEETNSDTKNED